jgi:Holliday junction resolvase
MDQIKILKRFAWRFMAEAGVAVKFINQTKWIFIKPQSLELNEKDKTVSIDYNTALLKGISLKELVSNELQERLI